MLALNHSDDSDSIGSITGNNLGLINGYESIPVKWRQNLVRQEIVKQVGEDLFIRVKGNTFDMDDEWWEKYPGY